METTSQHHYTFTVEEPGTFGVVPSVNRREASADADSHAEALNVVSAANPKAARIYLARIDKIGAGCGDERCAVCYPSRRNGGR